MALVLLLYSLLWGEIKKRENFKVSWLHWLQWSHFVSTVPYVFVCPLCLVSFKKINAVYYANKAKDMLDIYILHFLQESLIHK